MSDGFIDFSFDDNELWNTGFTFVKKDILVEEFINLVETKTGSKHIKTEKQGEYKPYVFIFRPADGALEMTLYYLTKKLPNCRVNSYFNLEDENLNIRFRILPSKLYESIADLMNKEM